MQLKTVSKRAIEKTAKATRYLIDKITDKITSVLKKKSSKASQNNET